VFAYVNVILILAYFARTFCYKGTFYFENIIIIFSVREKIFLVHIRERSQEKYAVGHK
jgi:hypothetical protein